MPTKKKSDGRWLRLILHGKVAREPAVREAVEGVRAAGHEVEVRVTWEPGDAERFAREAAEAGVEVMVAGGGDGTLNEVATGLLADREDAPRAMGLLPLGTGNDFARACGIPLEDPFAALTIVTDTEPVPIDVGKVNGRLFVNLASGGSGTEIIAETNEDLKKVLGSAAYLLTGLRRFLDIQPVEAKLSGPDLSWEGELIALAVGNGRFAGGGIPLCPDALLDDGQLDVSVLPAPAAEQRVERIVALLREGRGAIESEMESWRTDSLTIEVPESMYINLDGEPLKDTKFEFELLGKALAFHLPETAPLS
ncbi:MAG: lipid kinase YegS [Gemmatimonadetes bacterium]|uniref:Lipid kinase YegS n=1 Tax=Candidatus Kutchimonas denitrificans TaxID=3056748 RepID=A0AAE4ZBQ6_9BACT|nr:lipid kinase YegS [Gemmatimonadota bacterium]NIR76056.1 lipid kinase YegS [Candidatus Kutchimonas denitrificans]NIS00435.1 lipid kinase YegS [Gemmatimonadota bacterium]NIT66093.1 lipid kinase YegS [Gemmatimonadota bacterium]NIU54171.1 lipid kinase YegS [Gemmatimonadota bacterium]